MNNDIKHRKATTLTLQMLEPEKHFFPQTFKVHKGRELYSVWTHLHTIESNRNPES